MLGLEIKNLNRALMLLATAVIVLMAAPPISALAKDDTARQLAYLETGVPKQEAPPFSDNEEKHASR